MTFDPSFLDMMKDEITVQSGQTLDVYGAPSAGTSSTKQCRIVRKNKLARDAAGAEVVAGTQVWLQAPSGISVTDTVTMPDGSTPVIIAIEAYPDEDGLHHEVLLFQ